jgi:hypothetical protein
MKAQAETWGPPRGKMAVKFRIKSSKPVIETEATPRSYHEATKSSKPVIEAEATPRSYHDRVMDEISNTGMLPNLKTIGVCENEMGNKGEIVSVAEHF